MNDTKEFKYIIDESIKDFQKYYQIQIKKHAKSFAQQYFGGKTLKNEQQAIFEGIDILNEQIF